MTTQVYDKIWANDSSEKFPFQVRVEPMISWWSCREILQIICTVSETYHNNILCVLNLRY